MLKISIPYIAIRSFKGSDSDVGDDHGFNRRIYSGGRRKIRLSDLAEYDWRLFLRIATQPRQDQAPNKRPDRDR